MKDDWTLFVPPTHPPTHLSTPSIQERFLKHAEDRLREAAKTVRELPGERRKEDAVARQWEVEADTWMVREKLLAPTHPPTHPPVHPRICSSTYPPTHPPTLPCSFIHPLPYSSSSCVGKT